MSVLKIECFSCNTVKEVPKSKLMAYYDKTIGIKCNSCKFENRVKVDADLFNKDHIRRRNHFETVIVTDEQSSHNRGKTHAIQVLQNRFAGKQIFNLSEGENLVGRHSSSDDKNKISIFTEDKQMSRSHCIITVKYVNKKLEAILKDNRSTNGTYLNNDQNSLSENEEIFLEPNDEIRIGQTTIKYTVE